MIEKGCLQMLRSKNVTGECCRKRLSGNVVGKYGRICFHHFVLGKWLGSIKINHKKMFWGGRGQEEKKDAQLRHLEMKKMLEDGFSDVL